MKSEVLHFKSSDAGLRPSNAAQGVERIYKRT